MICQDLTKVYELNIDHPIERKTHSGGLLIDIRLQVKYNIEKLCEKER